MVQRPTVSCGQPIENRRYSRFKICATSERQWLRFLSEGLIVFLIGATALLPTPAHSQAIQAWVQQSDIPSHTWLPRVALALDASGNVVVSGASHGGDGSGEDALIIKYSSAGTPVWTNRYNGPGNLGAGFGAIAADGSGNVVVAGASTGVGTDRDCTTIKYSTGGEPLWTNRYDGPAHSGDYATAIAGDTNGKVFVTGSSAAADYPDYCDYATVAYSSAGVPLWTNRYNGPAHGPDYPQAIAVDASGNVFVTGYSRGSGIDDNFLTIKYSSAGAPLWTRRYLRPGDQWARANALAMDAGGNVIVTGGAAFAGITTIKYSGAGVPMWTNYFYGFADERAAVAVDANDDVYVTWGVGRVDLDWI